MLLCNGQKFIKISKANINVSITGIAGPRGGINKNLLV